MKTRLDTSNRSLSYLCLVLAILLLPSLTPARPVLLGHQYTGLSREILSQESAKELIQQGDQAQREGDLSRALKAFSRAKDVAEGVKDNEALAEALSRMGNVLRLQGNYDEALKHLQASIALSEAKGDKQRLAPALNTAGIIYQGQGEMARALDYYQKSLALSEAVGDKVEIARSLNNLGAYYRNISELNDALSYYRRALAINEELGNKPVTAMVLGNIGNVHMAQGEFSDSLEFFQRSLKLRQEMKDERGIANILNFLGINYRALGDEAQALDHFQQSLALQERFKNRYGVAFALEYIGISSLNWKNDKSEAVSRFQKSLEIYESLKDKHGMARVGIWLGRVYHAQGDHNQALGFYQKGLALYLETGDKAGTIDVLISISDAYRGQGDPTKALTEAKRATALAKQILVQRFIADAHVAEGKAYQALGQSESAREAYAAAIAAVELSRSRIAGNSTRASYFTTVREPYELYVDVLMSMHKERPTGGFDLLAFQMSERGRARSLLEALSEARADIRQGVDPTLLKLEQGLHQQLNTAGDKQSRLLSGKHSAEEVSLVEKQIAALTSEFQEVQAQITKRSPRYAALTQPVPLSVRQIQTEVLDSETMLLEYALGQEKSYLWALTSNSVVSFELPKRAEIETSIRRVVELLSNGRRWTTSSEIDSEYKTAASRLSQTLLPHQLMSSIKVKRLVIVGDGALQYLPFGALPSSKANAQTSKAKKEIAGNKSPLIADFEIVTLPSASVLKVLRTENSSRPRGQKSVAVLADPVFEETDQRISAVADRPSGSQVSSLPPAKIAGSRALLERAFRVDTSADGESAKGDTQRITRLPFTRFEADGVLASAPPDQSLKATDFRANRETATSPELAKHRYVHFATHGILNSEHPELSGLVLSLVNEQGQPVNGFLRLHDIYNLNLPADLVVLSACQTGLGKEIRGEGLIGLTRGFMYAGSPRVVASLWKVDDAATAELMKRFYRGMLKDKLAPAAALRVAKVEMWKQKRWNAPFYWAAFELQGEWK
ncbi:MAG TPA: CHAT domain-containing tetratricopeptide repeat protein [Pyrinomonadaceae bacterium]|nr:CHAT domain-containing tetratricopeptide repeat protein [Pyrinomonadaceae bacterium]